MRARRADGGRRGTARLFVLALAASLAAPAAGRAQSEPPPGGADTAVGGAAEGEVRLLRDASVAEAQGNLARADSLLSRILDARAASAPALLALERVLRVQGRTGELVPRADAAVAADPGSALLNQVRVRMYAALDRTDALRSAERSWMDAAPATETAYREIARLEMERGKFDRARAVLEEGRRQLKQADALALEMGDLLVAIHEPRLAVAEWDRAIGADGGGLSQVRRRLRAMPDGGAAVMGELVERLMAPPASQPRRVAAVQLAVDAGLENDAERVAQGLLQPMSLEARSVFLAGIARRADSAHRDHVAYWAYRRLLETEEAVGSRGRGAAGDAAAVRTLALRTRVAELALAVGDTARAAETYESVRESSDAGSPERREAAALHVELLARDDPDGALAALQAFRSEFPTAPELDRAAAAVAAAVLAAGRATEAAAVIGGVRGPRTSMLRARMSLAGGEVEAARTALLNAVAGLRGGEATQVLALATLLTRLSPAAGARIGEALDHRDDGDPGTAVDVLTAEDPSLDEGDRPAMLDFAAALADSAGLADDAGRIRRELVSKYPRSMEAPKALLALARALRPDPAALAEARELLERLILEYPRSALAPQARRELERLGQGVAQGSRKE